MLITIDFDCHRWPALIGICVGWKVTLCDPILQVTLHSSVMGFPLRAILGFNL